MANLYSPGNANRNYWYNLTTSGSADDATNRLNQAYMQGSSNRSYGGGGGGGAVYAGGGGGGMLGGGGGGVPDFINQYQQRFDQANAANESRYGQILGDYNALYGRQMSSFDQGNAQNIADINTNYNATGAANTQDLIDRGLTASTISANIRSGNERDRTAAVNRENFNFQNARRSADAGLTTDRLNFMERRNDEAPDVGQLIALAQAYGNANGGNGGAGGYGGASWGGMQTGFGALTNSGFGTTGPIFGGFSHMPAVNAAQARQTANTRNVYGYANQNPGYAFNSGYSDPYRGMQDNRQSIYQSVLGTTPYYGNVA